jgi:hypothetical protein
VELKDRSSTADPRTGSPVKARASNPRARMVKIFESPETVEPAMMDRSHEWARLLADVTGLVNQQLLLQNEYLAAENGSCGAVWPRTTSCSSFILKPGG